MSDLFSLSLDVFLLVVILSAISPIRRRIGTGVWVGVGLGSLLQAVLGAVGMASRVAAQLFSFPAVPVLGTWSFQVDPLSSLLFLILGCVGVASALMAMEHARHRSPGTSAGMAAIVAVQFIFTSFLLTAQNALPMLIGWEAMSLCAYAYVLVIHQRRTVRRAAYVTLLVSEVGFLLLVLAFVLAAPANGPFDFVQIAAHLRTAPIGTRDAVFLLALFGFGAKSGVLPMQLWMPDAYDSAPAHLNAILAGALLNLGLFGILRVTTLTGPPSVWVSLLVVWVGVIALLSGALFAVVESRMRRLLAYSSIENVGLMVISLGITMLFTAHGNAQFADVAMMALFVQMVSHALAKSLAFLVTGEIARRIGSTDLDDLGGLFRYMPGVGLAFLAASLSLSAVAPFSGFASEWLTLQGMMQVYRSLPGVQQVLVAIAGMIAAVGAALAMTTFLKVFAFAMTGRARKTVKLDIPHLHHTGAWGAMSLGLLAVLSVFYGWFPTGVMPLFQRVAVQVLPATGTLEKIVPTVFHNPPSNATMVNLGAGGFGFLPIPGFVIEPGDFVATIAPTYMLFWFLVFALLGLGISRVSMRQAYHSRTAPAWLGGREHRVAVSQYTSSAYVNPYRMFWSGLVGHKMDRRLVDGDRSLPQKWQINRTMFHWLAVDHLFVPSVKVLRWLERVRSWQHGYLWGYLLTILGAVMILLAIAVQYPF